MINDKRILIEKLKEDPWFIYKNHDDISSNLFDDKEIALLAVSMNEFSLEYFSERLKDNDDVVMEAILLNDSACKYASSRLKNDRCFLLKAFDYKITKGINNGVMLSYVSEELKDDYDIVYKAVKGYGLQIEDASERLRDDDVLCFLAVDNFPPAFEFISHRLRDDKTILLAALRKVDKEDAKEILSYASERLKQDETIIRLIEEKH